MNAAVKNTLEIGTLINDKWVILEFIGRGGMGEVYRAHQVNLKRDVAIKIISRQWIASCEDNEEELETGLQRFRREVQAMAQVRHPNILQVFDYGSIAAKQEVEDVTTEFIAMEYVPGSTLRSTMSEEGFYPETDLTRDWLRNYFFPVLDGVEAMHKFEIVHRDLKPENVLMDGKTPKIADFGLARSSRLKPVTQSMDIKGTLAYMSPEHFFEFGKADRQADIYSLGKILFEAIAGKLTSKTQPFKSVNLENSKSPFYKKLDRIIQDATAEDQEKRLKSVGDFRKALLEAIDTPEDRTENKSAPAAAAPARPFSAFAHPKWLWTGIAVAFLSVALMAFWLWHFWGEPGKSMPHMTAPQITSREMVLPPASGPAESPLPSRASLPPTLATEDDATLYLMPGGPVTLPENFGPDSGKTLEVQPFYMDETQVTNHQYVEFLNQVLAKISADKGVVQAEGEIWLFLGEVIEGYEPIVFRDNRFHIKKAAHAGCPVLRITAYGASAYARFYGRRLPTEAEWLQAARTGGTVSQEKLSENAAEVGEQARASVSASPLTIHSPVMLFEPNDSGIRGLNKIVSEWGLRIPNTSSSVNQGEMEYVILGGLGRARDKEHAFPYPMLRQPWEAFEEVGFRCVRSATSLEK
jgi:serine/threonine-protein kinase